MAQITYVYTIQVNYVTPVPGSPTVEPAVFLWTGLPTVAELMEFFGNQAEEIKQWEMYAGQLRTCVALVRRLTDELLQSDDVIQGINGWSRGEDGVAFVSSKYFGKPLVLAISRKVAYTSSPGDTE